MAHADVETTAASHPYDVPYLRIFPENEIPYLCCCCSRKTKLLIIIFAGLASASALCAFLCVYFKRQDYVILAISQNAKDSFNENILQSAVIMDIPDPVKTHYAVIQLRNNVIVVLESSKHYKRGTIEIFTSLGVLSILNDPNVGHFADFPINPPRDTALAFGELLECQSRSENSFAFFSDFIDINIGYKILSTLCHYSIELANSPHEYEVLYQQKITSYLDLYHKSLPKLISVANENLKRLPIFGKDKPAYQEVPIHPIPSAEGYWFSHVSGTAEPSSAYFYCSAHSKSSLVSSVLLFLKALNTADSMGGVDKLFERKLPNIKAAFGKFYITHSFQFGVFLRELDFKFISQADAEEAARLVYHYYWLMLSNSRTMAEIYNSWGYRRVFEVYGVFQNKPFIPIQGDIGTIFLNSKPHKSILFDQEWKEKITESEFRQALDLLFSGCAFVFRDVTLPFEQNAEFRDDKCVDKKISKRDFFEKQEAEFQNATAQWHDIYGALTQVPKNLFAATKEADAAHHECKNIAISFSTNHVLKQRFPRIYGHFFNLYFYAVQSQICGNQACNPEGAFSWGSAKDVNTSSKVTSADNFQKLHVCLTNTDKERVVDDVFRAMSRMMTLNPEMSARQKLNNILCQSLVDEDLTLFSNYVSLIMGNTVKHGLDGKFNLYLLLICQNNTNKADFAFFNSFVQGLRIEAPVTPGLPLEDVIMGTRDRYPEIQLLDDDQIRKIVADYEGRSYDPVEYVHENGGSMITGPRVQRGRHFYPPHRFGYIRALVLLIELDDHVNHDMVDERVKRWLASLLEKAVTEIVTQNIGYGAKHSVRPGVSLRMFLQISITAFDRRENMEGALSCFLDKLRGYIQSMPILMLVAWIENYETNEKHTKMKPTRGKAADHVHCFESKCAKKKILADTEAERQRGLCIRDLILCYVDNFLARNNTNTRWRAVFVQPAYDKENGNWMSVENATIFDQCTTAKVRNADSQPPQPQDSIAHQPTTVLVSPETN